MDDFHRAARVRVLEGFHRGVVQGVPDGLVPLQHVVHGVRGVSSLQREGRYRFDHVGRWVVDVVLADQVLDDLDRALRVSLPEPLERALIQLLIDPRVSGQHGLHPLVALLVPAPVCGHLLLLLVQATLVGESLERRGHKGGRVPHVALRHYVLYDFNGPANVSFPQLELRSVVQGGLDLGVLLQELVEVGGAPALLRELPQGGRQEGRRVPHVGLFKNELLEDFDGPVRGGP
mmetsp:Transcript_51121/g.143967  ORF Transcript_51121/g.143967 Transcript_51121/m.143967 type:complete len:233 (+) Transcript_51121:1108-1806(+)